MFKKKLEVKNEILKRMELTDKLFVLIDNLEEMQRTFQSLWTYLKSFLENVYNSPKFISKLLSLSKIEDIKNHLAPFFTNNFFENILSAQSLENDLIYIIYNLLKEEIDSLPDYNSSTKFLDNTPCSYLLEQLIEKTDIKSFCRLIIIKVVEDLEWTFSGKKICLDIENIVEGLNHQKEKEIKIIEQANNKNNNNNNTQNKKQNNNLRKSYSIFSAFEDEIENNKNKNVENNNKENNHEINAENNNDFNYNNPSHTYSRVSTFSSFDGFGEKEYMKQKKNFENSREFNSKYIIDINPKQYENEKNENLKEFIECQNEFNKNNWSLNSNEAFINNVFKGENSEEILSIYILSFIKVIESINLLFKNLLANTGIVPYSIKCICKIIYILLKNKFPNIKKLHLNAFMSRFVFDKLLLPFLENPIFGALINEYMISPETVTNIKSISDVISHICKGQLYTQQEEKGNYTPFNKFLLEKINDVYNFYQNIEEVILPDFITGNKDIEKIKDEEPFIQKSLCFSFEEIYALVINVSHNKEKLFVDESTKLMKIVFSKIDKDKNMKIFEEIKNEKVYENKEQSNNKNNSKKKHSIKEIKKIEIEKYFLVTELLTNKQFSEIFNIEKGKSQFQIKELKKPQTKEDHEKNNIIKVKNILCTILYYLREINIQDFNNISTSLSDTDHIFKEIKKLIKTSYFRIDDSIPFDWYVSSLFQIIGKLPKNYIDNDYELLYKELKEDIIKSINSFDVSILSNISDKLKYGKRKKKFYEKAEKRLVDITLNEKVQYILDKLRVPCELYFCYNDKEKRINVKEIKKDDNTLKFLDAMIFVEQSRYIKTCNIIRDFTKYFPNIVKSSIFFGENDKIYLECIEDIDVETANDLTAIQCKYYAGHKNRCSY